jgi:hypothetical protein
MSDDEPNVLEVCYSVVEYPYISYLWVFANNNSEKGVTVTQQTGVILCKMNGNG